MEAAKQIIPVVIWYKGSQQVCSAPGSCVAPVWLPGCAGCEGWCKAAAEIQVQDVGTEAVTWRNHHKHFTGTFTNC